MAKKRARPHVANSPKPPVRARARNERYRRPDGKPKWLLAVGGALGVLAIGWWGMQAWSKTPAEQTATTASEGAISIGAEAPAVALPSTSGGQLSLDQYRGSRVVVYFYEGVG